MDWLNTNWLNAAWLGTTDNDVARFVLQRWIAAVYVIAFVSGALQFASLWLFRWLLFRMGFGAGMIKMRGDRVWRDLTALYDHHETQPMPNPLSWWPLKNLFSRNQAMNASFIRRRRTAYGAFGSITRERYEVEGWDGHSWLEYDFRGKLGQPGCTGSCRF